MKKMSHQFLIYITSLIVIMNKFDYYFNWNEWDKGEDLVKKKYEENDIKDHIIYIFLVDGPCAWTEMWWHFPPC